MFSDGVANTERKRHAYCDKHENEDKPYLDELRDTFQNSRSFNTRRRILNNHQEDDLVDDEQEPDQDDENNYKCQYKIKSVHMSAIRCRLDEQQSHEQKKYLYQQQQQQQQQQQLREETGAHSVINLARTNVVTEQRQPTYLSYNLSPHTSSHIQHTNYPMPPTTITTTKQEDAADLSCTSHNTNSSPTPTTSNTILSSSASTVGEETTVGGTAAAAAAAAAAATAAANRRDHNIDYSTLFVQLSGTLPTLYRCVNCNKIVSNRWHHANIHRPQSHVCPVCGQKFTRRDNMKAHCKIKHADIKDRFFSHYVHM